MQFQIKTHGYALTPFDKVHLDRCMEQLDRLTDTYEMRHMLVTVSRTGHSNDCDVKMVLSLARRRLVVEQREPGFVPAAQHCVDVLARKIRLAKERVHRRHGERAVRRAKDEAALANTDELRAAVAKNDYEAFVDALHEVPESVEAELGRRLKRHPEAEALLGDEFVIADLVEGVLRKAFENFAVRSPAGPIQDWLHHWIDPVIDELVEASIGVKPPTAAAG